MSDLHQRVRAARRARVPRLTQAEVAERAGVSLGTYQMFETGKSTPQGANLQAILDQFPELAGDAADAAIAEATREEWPLHIRVFLDAIGAFVDSMDDIDDQLAFIHEETRRIIGSR